MATNRFWESLLTLLFASLAVFIFAVGSAFGQSASPTFKLNPSLLELPKGRWVKIHQQRFSDAVTFKRQVHGGSAFDSRRGRLVLFGSDTHGKDWLNSPLFFDLARLEWQQAYPADSLSTYRVNAEGLSVAGANGDHPWAMHTFGAVTYDPGADAIVVASYPQHMVPGRFTSVLAPLWPQVKRHPTWVLHLESGRWEPLAGNAVHFFPHATAFDAGRGTIFGYNSAGVYELSLATGQWRNVAKGGLLEWANNVVFDTENEVLVAYGDHNRRNDVVVFEPATGRHQKMATPGLRPAGGAYVPMAYHPDIGKTVAIIDRAPADGAPPDGATQAETWLYEYAGDAWTHLAEADLPFSVGMNFNFEFDPGHRLLLLVAVPPDEPLTAVWALRVEDESRHSLWAAKQGVQAALEEAQDANPHASQPSLPLPPGDVGEIRRDEHGKIVPVNRDLPSVRVCPPDAQNLDCQFRSIAKALATARDGDTIIISAGDYREAGVLRANGVTIRAERGAHMRGFAAEGKAALVIKGDDAIIEGLECSEIWVEDGNGACVRAEGRNLTLREVYFHDSQEGILGGRGTVIIEDSVFERLGGDEKIALGQAHAIYISEKTDQLILRRNRILSSKEEGHEVKSRAKLTLIENNVIASLSGRDSRLIDIPNGGITVIRNNILEKGPNSSNPDVIGVGLERGRNPAADPAVNSTLIEGNTIILDRHNRTELVHIRGMPPAVVTGNTIIGGLPSPNNSNRWFIDRAAAGLAPYPQLQQWVLPADEVPKAEDLTSRRGKLVLRPPTSEAIWNGATVQLTPQEFRVLSLLTSRSNEVVLEKEVYAAMLNPSNATDKSETDPTNAVKRLVKGLRRKFSGIDPAFANIIVYPERGFGWNE